MNKNFKHFVVTRFNLKVETWNTTKNKEAVLTNEWLDTRFELFENYCLPSFLNQSNKNFKWYVFFDTDTPAQYKLRIDRIADRCEHFFPVYIDNITVLQSSLISLIKRDIPAKKVDFVITTRVDNDDIIHKDFIALIQSVFKPISGAVIDIPDGYQVSIEKAKAQVREYYHPFNAFVSVIEKVENLKTIMSRMHYGWKDSKTVIEINEKIWIELVHSKNKINSIRKRIKKNKVFAHQDFGMKPDLAPLESKWIIYISNIYMAIKYFIVDILRKNKTVEGVLQEIKRIFRPIEAS